MRPLRRRALGALLLSGGLFFPRVASAGFVTPAIMSMAFNSISLIDSGGHDVSLQATPGTLTFKASDPDFAATDLGPLTVPAGRYLGIGLGVGNTRTITLDGNHRYVGSAGAGFQNGDYLCTTGAATDGSGVTGAATAGAASCATPSALTFNLPNSPSLAVVSFAYFSQPVCITTPVDQSTLCLEGDTFMDATVAEGLQVSVMLDLLDSIHVDPDRGAIDSFPTYPFAVLGPPGASVHLQFTSDLDADGTVSASGHMSVGDVTLLMDSSKHVIYATADYDSETEGPDDGAEPNGHNIPGYCDGQAWLEVSATPSGATPSPYMNIVAQFDPATGEAAFAVDSAANGAPDPAGGIDFDRPRQRPRLELWAAERERGVRRRRRRRDPPRVGQRLRRLPRLHLQRREREPWHVDLPRDEGRRPRGPPGRDGLRDGQRLRLVPVGAISLQWGAQVDTPAPTMIPGKVLIGCSACVVGS